MISDGVLGCSILIVDDDAGIVLALTASLEHEGFTDIRSTTDPRHSLELLDERTPDLVIVDLNMPELDGTSVMAALRARMGATQFVPVLMLTAETDVRERHRVLAAGATDLLHKPFDTAEALLRIRNLLGIRVVHGRLEQSHLELTERLDRHEAAASRRAGDRDMKRQRITRALAGDVSHMVFQPIIDLRNEGRLLGVEALSRFDLEPVRTPDRWFAEALEVGLAFELELAAVLAAVEELDQLPPGSFLAVNVSASTAATERFRDALQGIDLGRLVVELTEHTWVDDYETLALAVNELRSRGARFAVDDAGAGYASLLHILRLRPDIIKLDLALTRGIDSDPVRRALAEALVAFGTRIGLTILAEGVETQGELAALTEIGIHGAQGYFVGRPAPLLLGGERPLAHGER